MKIVHAPNGVIYIKSKLIPCTHGFAARVGGVSKAVHTASLNLAFGRGDDEATVLHNLRLFSEAAGFDPCSVISLRQVHSSNIRTVTAADRELGYYTPSNLCCDGYVTADPQVTLGVKTADCVPILLCATDDSGRPAVAAALHAGWRGTLAGIAVHGVNAMISLGARPGQIFAAIGPAIGQCCFEIDTGLKDKFFTALGAEICSRCFRPSKTRPDKWHADLKGLNAHLLRSCGIPPGNIDISDSCTCCNPKLFYSHRRDHEHRGTMLSVINLTT
jgi:YfiH family protein